MVVKASYSLSLVWKFFLLTGMPFLCKWVVSGINGPVGRGGGPLALLHFTAVNLNDKRGWPELYVDLRE